MNRSIQYGLGFVGGIAALFAVSSAVLAAEFKFDLANEYQASSLPGQTDADFAKAVTITSGGRIEVTNHPGGGLGFKSRQHFEAVMDGAIPIASTPFSSLEKIEPIFDLQSLPFITTTVNETEAMFIVAKPYYAKAFNMHNQTLLYGAPWTPQGIWEKTKIRKPEDLKGLKIRTYNAQGAEVLKAAGASPIQLSWADVIPALSNGTITGVLTSDEGGVNSKFWELGCKYFNSIGFAMGINAVTMNLDSYNALPVELKIALRVAADRAEQAAWRRARSRVSANKETLKSVGAEYVEDVPASVIDHIKVAAAPLKKAWIKNMGADEAAKIMAKFDAFMKANYGG